MRTCQVSGVLGMLYQLGAQGFCLCPWISSDIMHDRCRELPTFQSEVGTTEVILKGKAGGEFG